MLKFDLAAAVLDDATGVPAHYGNPFREQQALLEGYGVTNLSFMEVLSVRGADRKRWLHNLTTCAFELLPEGTSTQMLILDPHGHIEHSALVVDDGTQVWMLVDAGAAQPLANFLESMKFMLRVEITVHQAKVWVMLGGASKLAPALREDLEARALAVWVDSWPRSVWDAQGASANYGVLDEDHPAAERRAVFAAFDSEFAYATEHASVGAVDQAAGAADPTVVSSECVTDLVPAGLLAWEAARVRHWRPRFATEALERTLPHELDLLRTAVHLEKGCYRGQETVAKIVNLGRPPRRLTYLYLEGPEGELPLPGTEIYNGARKVGVLTSVARDFEAGPVALALLRRSTAADALLSVGEFVATQECIVSPEGKSSVSPSERPGAELRRMNGQG